MIIAFSEASLQSLCPENKDSVRGDLLLAGWLLEKTGEKETRVQLIQELDFKGNIPKFAVSSTNDMQAEQLKMLPAVIAAYCKANGRS